MEEMIKSVLRYAKDNPEGFTLDINSMKPVKFGICVAYIETQNCHGEDGIKKAIEHARLHNNIVGGWLDEGGMLYYFDSVKVFPNKQMKEAIDFAKTNKQYAIFDLTNLKEIIL